ncbi:helix-turn-helix domain-containing protein [Atrimonas thermophila]|uniref:helix-turn-helix domain-containing protein n=1 Tax=Atrimonas thermophila TaxID=3064161 RepID=UPI00399CAEC7
MAVVWEVEDIKMVVLRPKDVQKILGIGKAKAYELFRRHDFPAVKLGRSWYVSLKAFQKWLEERNVDEWSVQ